MRDLLDMPGLGLRLLTDVTGLDRAVQHVYTTDLPDPGRYLTPGDLVLTGMIWCREPGDAERFVRALAKGGAFVLGAGEALGQVPPEVIQACGRYGVTLLAVPAETSFAAVTEEVARRLSGDRATAMTRVLGRRRLLLSAVAEGAGLDAMFRLMGRETGAECWLLTGMGRVVSGTGASMTEPLAARLACEYLRADRLPAVARASEERYSLFGVGGEPRITSWFLACRGREQDWPHELRESVAELAADVALERARLDAGRAGDRKLAEAIVTMLASQAGEGEIAPLMRTAGLPPDGRYLIARLCAEADRVTGPNADRWRCDLAEELVARSGERAVVAPLGEEIVMLVRLPPDDPEAAHAFAARLREAEPLLASDRSRLRLSVGVSTPAEGMAAQGMAAQGMAAQGVTAQGVTAQGVTAQGVTALPGALHEAGSARRLAALRGGEAGIAGLTGASGSVSVLASDEVASHEVLLATLPSAVLRSFRERLLGPLLAYDASHRADLLPTLREFLACSGSWNACSAKMYVHVNTVRYRIRRIEELTGRDLSSLEDQVDFFLALRIR